MKVSKEMRFWQWFKENNFKFSSISNMPETEREHLLNEFLVNLHRYCRKFFFQIANDKNENELVISADGNERYFGKVKQLVNSAPPLENWIVIALKPPTGLGVMFEYEDIRIDPRLMWFVHLESRDTKKFALRFGIPEFDSKKEQTYLEAVFQILDSLLGEETSARSIGYVEVCNLPDDPEEEGYIKLSELPKYVESKIKS